MSLAPLVLDAGQVRQAASTEDLDLSLEGQVRRLEVVVLALCTTLLNHGIDLPDAALCLLTEET